MQNEPNPKNNLPLLFPPGPDGQIEPGDGFQATWDINPTLQSVLPSLTGHGIWARGGEWNTLPKGEFASRPLRVLITRLSTYADTCESFTHTLLYQTLASLPQVFPDLGYLPPRRDGELLSAAGLPWLFGTQTHFSPQAFDVIALSNAIVQELANLPTLLQKSGLWKSQSERLADAHFPILILGGANSIHTGLLDHPDSPIDGIFTGENLEDIQALFCLCSEGKKLGLSKAEVLHNLEAIPGFCQPGTGTKTKKRNTETLDIRKLGAPRPVLYKLEGLGQEPVAISRGCPAFCSFCAEAFDQKPYRENPEDVVVENALQLKREMGLEGVDLFSFNFNFYEDLYPLLENLGKRFNSIGLKSQRFDMIAREPMILEYLRGVGKTSLTFGMEGISMRLRRYLQKGLEEPDLWKALTAVFRQPLRELKVFLIATGLEEEEDFLEFEAFVRKIPDLMRHAPHRHKVTFSSTPLVRFPWTPLEFATAFTPERYGKVTRRIGHIARQAGFQYRDAAEEAENFLSQSMVRADRPEYWEALCAAISDTNFLYNREVDAEMLEALRTRLAERGLTDEKVLGGFDLIASANKPWVRWDTGVRRNFLWVQYKRAARWEDKGYCLGTTEKAGQCLACDSCETKEDEEFLTHQRRKHAEDPEGFEERLKAYRRSAQPISLAVTWSEKVIGLPRKYPGLVLASALMRAAQNLTPEFWKYRSSRAPVERERCWVAGDDVIELDWQPDGLEWLKTHLSEPEFLNKVNAALGDWGTLKGEVEALVLPPGQSSTGLLQPALWIFESPVELAFEGYAKATGLKHTLLRREGVVSIELSRESAKKKLVKKAICKKIVKQDNSMSWQVELMPDIKFSPEHFIQTGFNLKKPENWSQIKGFAKLSVN